MALERHGFKMADVDESQLKYVVPHGFTDFMFQKNGNHTWQILDSVPREKVFFMTMNYHNETANILVWSLSNNN